MRLFRFTKQGKREKLKVKERREIMKKIILSLLLMGICVNTFAQQAVIREVSGTVELKAPGTSSYVPANNGDSVSEDTLISTGFKSSAIIEAGSVLIVVRPLTRLTLVEIRSTLGTETLHTNLAAGRVRVDVNPPAGTRASMSVSSPSATASVRGTGFEMDMRRIIVVEGRVGYRGSRGGLVIVDAGYDSVVLKDGRVSNPQGNIIAGFRPSPPVGYDPYSASGSGAGPFGLYVPVPDKPTPPSPGSPGSGGAAGGGGSGSGTGSSGGDMGGVIIDSW